MKEEIWKDIPGYEGVYQVSSIGRVRSVDRVVTRRDGRDFLKKVKYKNYKTMVMGIFINS